MPGTPNDNPLQSALWTHLLRVQTQAEWALSLGLDRPQLSRTVAGSRAMSPDELQVAVFTCRRRNRPDVAARVIEALTEALVGDDVPKQPANPIEAVMDAARAGGTTAAAVQAALADGVISFDEAKDLEAAADAHEDVAGKLRGLAHHAREHGVRTMPRFERGGR